METLRVQHLAGYGLEVPEIEQAERFYTAFGLAASHEGGALQLRSLEVGPPEMVVLKGSKPARAVLRSGPGTSFCASGISVS